MRDQKVGKKSLARRNLADQSWKFVDNHFIRRAAARKRSIEEELSSLHLEIAEIIKNVSDKSNLLNICLKKLEELKGSSAEIRNLITEGLKLIDLNHEGHEDHEEKSIKL